MANRVNECGGGDFLKNHCESSPAIILLAPQQQIMDEQLTHTAGYLSPQFFRFLAIWLSIDLSRHHVEGGAMAASE